MGMTSETAAALVGGPVSTSASATEGEQDVANDTSEELVVGFPTGKAGSPWGTGPVRVTQKELDTAVKKGWLARTESEAAKQQREAARESAMKPDDTAPEK